MTRKTVLIVDDSATMRALIRAALERHPELEVVGEAGDPLQARLAIRAFRPDVLTLDIEMPNMNGLEFLERMMRLKPMPVVMVSTLTQAGADATIAALELGAVDWFAKPQGVGAAAFDGLAEVVAAAARARVFATPDELSVDSDPGYRPTRGVVAIGSSTGGVEALMAVLGRYPPNGPATVVTQHMPATFTASLAARLDRTCAPRIAEARGDERLLPGHVYLAPGGARHTIVRRQGNDWVLALVEGEAVSGHRPSVDRLFHSVAGSVGPEAVGVILTGMGRDGADGLLAMRLAGASTIGQDEASSVVFGMPKVAADIGAVQRQLPLGRIGPAILGATALSAVEVA